MPPLGMAKKFEGITSLLANRRNVLLVTGTTLLVLMSITRLWTDETPLTSSATIE